MNPSELPEVEGPVRNVLFIRQYPTSLSEKDPWHRWVRSYVSADGSNVEIEGHQVVFLFTGLGRTMRDPSQDLVRRIESGDITDIVDVGAGGALNPSLRKGDFVLSIGEVLSDGGKVVPTLRRPSFAVAAKAVAAKMGRRLIEGRILTHHAAVTGRRDKTEAYARTGCDVVQMEHGFFLERLRARLSPAAWEKLYVSHLELIADEVPHQDSWWETARETIDCLDACVVRNQTFLGPVKCELLKAWLSGASRANS